MDQFLRTSCSTKPDINGECCMSIWSTRVAKFAIYNINTGVWKINLEVHLRCKDAPFNHYDETLLNNHDIFSRYEYEECSNSSFDANCEIKKVDYIEPLV